MVQGREGRHCTLEKHLEQDRPIIYIGLREETLTVTETVHVEFDKRLQRALHVNVGRDVLRLEGVVQDLLVHLRRNCSNGILAQTILVVNLPRTRNLA